MARRSTKQSWNDDDGTRTRVLIECPPESSPSMIADAVARHGYAVRTCEGPDAGRCDLVHDGWTEVMWVNTQKASEDPAELEMLERSDFETMEALRRRVDEIVQDPSTAEKLKPWYGKNCKRVCFHDEYLPTFNRDNVKLVDTDGMGVDRITPNGVVVGDTEYKVDVLIYSTGFDNTSFYSHRLGFDPIGTGGVSLSEAWAKGMYSLHGTLADGFPNMLMNQALQGGQHINIAYASTKTSEHIAWIIKTALDENVVIEPERPAEDDWFNYIIQSALPYFEYFANCTPGYLSNERKEADESMSRSACYMGSAVDFKRELEKWRSTNEMPGVVKTPL